MPATVHKISSEAIASGRCVLSSGAITHSVNLGDVILVGEERFVVEEINYTTQEVTVRPFTKFATIEQLTSKEIKKEIAKKPNLTRSKAEWGF